MSESSGNRKSRRRFLADVLFLGGGLTAAGLLAKYKLASPEPPQPGVAGGMQVPTAVPEAQSTPEVVQTPCKDTDIPPQSDCPKKTPPTSRPDKQRRKPADPFVGKVDPPPRNPNEPPKPYIPKRRPDTDRVIMGMYKQPEPPARN